MRVTGGDWASRRLAGPGSRASGIRPTPDALREQAFAVLSPHLEGARFLDLFAGTGANSIEALSRGARQAVLVESGRAAAELIRRNLASLGVGPDRARLLLMPAERGVARLADEGWSCSLAWCDPPFEDFAAGERALALARSAGVLGSGCLAVLELPPRRDPELVGFEVVRALRGAALLGVR